jgi:hypothetical protein
MRTGKAKGEAAKSEIFFTKSPSGKGGGYRNRKVSSVRLLFFFMLFLYPSLSHWFLAVPSF